MSEPDEGWGVIRPGARTAHYYRAGFSLCGRVGFYKGPLWAEDAAPPSPDDHKECRRKLETEKRKEAE